jgi:uncharacterized Zn-finger protein
MAWPEEMMQKVPKLQASTKRCYEISRTDLPLSCPTNKMRVWDAHPRVFLPIEKTGRAICPYCNAEYVIVDEK